MSEAILLGLTAGFIGAFASLLWLMGSMPLKFESESRYANNPSE